MWGKKTQNVFGVGISAALSSGHWTIALHPRQYYVSKLQSNDRCQLLPPNLGAFRTRLIFGMIQLGTSDVQLRKSLPNAQERLNHEKQQTYQLTINSIFNSSPQPFQKAKQRNKRECDLHKIRHATTKHRLGEHIILHIFCLVIHTCEIEHLCVFLTGFLFCLQNVIDLPYPDVLLISLDWFLWSVMRLWVQMHKLWDTPNISSSLLYPLPYFLLILVLAIR